jgi:hypothetical protein
MRRALPFAFLVFVLIAALSPAAGRQGVAGPNGSIRGAIIDAHSGAPIVEAQIRLTGGPIDPAALEKLKAALPRQIGIPPADLSLDQFIEALNDAAAAGGLALNNPQLTRAIAAFRSGNDARFKATTDMEGRFAIGNLPPGRYRVLAQREGYFGATVNSGAAAPASATVAVANGQTASVTLPMTPGATISGRITSNGSPQASLAVQAFAITYQNGYQVLQPIASRATDDRGQFRLYYLPPGRYLVAASPRTTIRPSLTAPNRPVPAADGPPLLPAEHPLRTFYPGTTDRGAAGFVTVREGREVTGIDIPMRSSALYTVSGEIRVFVSTSVMTAR